MTAVLHTYGSSSMTDPEVALFIECLQKTSSDREYRLFMSSVRCMRQRVSNASDSFTIQPHSETDVIKMVINEHDNDYIFNRRELVEGTIAPEKYNDDYLINYDVYDKNNVNISIGV